MADSLLSANSTLEGAGGGGADSDDTTIVMSNDHGALHRFNQLHADYAHAHAHGESPALPPSNKHALINCFLARKVININIFLARRVDFVS